MLLFVFTNCYSVLLLLSLKEQLYFIYSSFLIMSPALPPSPLRLTLYLSLSPWLRSCQRLLIFQNLVRQVNEMPLSPFSSAGNRAVCWAYCNASLPGRLSPSKLWRRHRDHNYTARGKPISLTQTLSADTLSSREDRSMHPWMQVVSFLTCGMCRSLCAVWLSSRESPWISTGSLLGK